MDPSRTYNFPEGEILLIDKPSDWTSFDVVNKIRHMIRHHLGIKKIKVGHAGTLDPLATGLLLVCVGKATKQIPTYTGLDKEYSGTFFIGATTPSFDLETEVDQHFETAHITGDDLEKASEALSGKIQQVPPAFSAIKINGTRAYRYARENEKVDIPPREVIIHRFDILGTELPEIPFYVRCSKGTYIRSLARDYGSALGSGAYLKALRRERIGDFDVRDAISITDLEDILRKIREESPSPD